MLVAAVNAIIDTLVACLTWLIGLLPDTPFQFTPVNWGPFADAIGLVFPLGDIATHFTLILSAFLVYYSVRWGLRLIRQIQ